MASDHEFTFGSAIESTKKISPGTAAVKWLLIMNLLLVQLLSLQRKTVMEQLP